MTRAYYITQTGNPEEPERHSVVVTTEHALSSYGQPVVIEDGDATPAQNFGHTLHLYFGNVTGESRRLVRRANELSGHSYPAEVHDAPEGFFA